VRKFSFIGVLCKMLEDEGGFLKFPLIFSTLNLIIIYIDAEKRYLVSFCNKMFFLYYDLQHSDLNCN
jgi:hypothetical protein